MSIYKPCDIRGDATKELNPGALRALGGGFWDDNCRPWAKFVVGGDVRASTRPFLAALIDGLCHDRARCGRSGVVAHADDLLCQAASPGRRLCHRHRLAQPGADQRAEVDAWRPAADARAGGGASAERGINRRRWPGARPHRAANTRRFPRLCRQSARDLLRGTDCPMPYRARSDARLLGREGATIPARHISTVPFLDDPRFGRCPSLAVTRPTARGPRI